MLTLIATTVYTESIEVELVDNSELFDTTDIDLAPQREVVKHLLEFMVRRTKLSDSAFIARGIKISDKEGSAAKFGLALMVESDRVSDEQVAQLQAELQVFASQIQHGEGVQPLGYEDFELDPLNKASLDADIRETLKYMKSQLGGKKVRVPIEIHTRKSLVAKIAKEILSKPDKAPSDTGNQSCAGVIKAIHFGPPHQFDVLIDVAENSSRKKKHKKKSILISHSESLDTLYGIAKCSQTALLEVKTYEANKKTVTELKTVEVLPSELKPLDSSTTP